MGLRHGCSRLAGVLVLVAVGVLGFSASALAAEVTFEPGGASELSLPAGVTEVHVTAVGGEGKPGNICNGSHEYAGGRGAKVTATLSVSKTLYVDFGGGGKGGGDNRCSVAAGGEGGGASDVRTEQDNLKKRLIVAGGGGGGGSGFWEYGAANGPYTEEAGTGGSAKTNAFEGEEGAKGLLFEDGLPDGFATGGGGGKETAGGTGGSFEGNGSCLEESLQNGKEGEGGEGARGCDGGGGGGGGGYYGGGGGGAGPGFEGAAGGGGAGSSYIATGATNTSVEVAPAKATQEVVITYTAPPCSTAEGTGTYLKRGEKGRFTVRDHLSTTLTGTQMLSVNTESGEARFGLTKLSSAKCEAVAGGFKFSGEGPSRYYRKTGYKISFSITVKGRKATFYAKLSDGSIVVNEEENALTKSNEVIQ